MIQTRRRIQLGLTAAAVGFIYAGMLKSADVAGVPTAYTHPITGFCVITIAINLIWRPEQRGGGARWAEIAALGAMVLSTVEILSMILTGAQVLSQYFNLHFAGAPWARGEMGLDTCIVLFATLMALRMRQWRMFAMVALVVSCSILLVTALGKWTGLPMFGGKMSDMTLASLGCLQGALLMTMLDKMPLRLLIMDSATGRNVRLMGVGSLLSISFALWASYKVGTLTGDYSARDLSMTMVALCALAAANFVLILLFGVGAQRSELQAKRRQRRIAYRGDHDYLTGLLNRRAGGRILRKRINQAVDKGQTLAIAVLDIDHFKMVNDTLGHQMGDQVLMQVARILKSQMRQGDTLIRWGGEEFLMCIEPQPGECLMGHADALRAQLAEMPLMVGDEHGVERITVSVGMAELTPEAPSLTRAIGRADAALLRAKDSGRNRVVGAPLAV